MSTTVPNNTTRNIAIREFSTDDVNFIANQDLRLELSKGGNANVGSGLYEEHVLVTIGVDDEHFNNVEVSAAMSNGYVDAIESAIKSLIVVRDALRKMEAAA
jgi:hypothetical protein